MVADDIYGLDGLNLEARSMRACYAAITIRVVSSALCRDGPDEKFNSCLVALKVFVVRLTHARHRTQNVPESSCCDP